jgi:hypothetical protein
MTHVSAITPARSAYQKPALGRLGAEGAMRGSGHLVSTGGLLPMDLLRAVQCALDELGLPLDRDLAAIKLQVLEEVSAGRLSEAVRLAIVAAGKSVGGSSD